MERRLVLLRRIRALIALVVVALFLSGVTVFPIQWELDVLTGLLGAPRDAPADGYSGFAGWLVTVRNGLREVSREHPWVLYGYDWLAFAHLVLAVLFVGPLRDPVRNLWVIDVGLVACGGVVLVAMICGPLRGIPFSHRLIDCAFGVFGFLPLWLARRWTLELAASGGETSGGEVSR